VRPAPERNLALAASLVLALAGLGRPEARAADRTAPGKPLPDSVLAAVGEQRRISVADFRRSWAQVSPPSRPDTLTPQTAREFLQLLIGKEVLAEAALRERWVWTREESASYVATRDHLVLQAAMERPLAEARAGLERDGATDPTAVGIAARDSAVARLHAEFDRGVLERLARAFAAAPKPPADSGVFAQLRTLGRNPELDPRDSLAIVARTTAGDYHVRDLMAWWGTLSPLARPRVENAEQMRDLAKNALFERELRRQAAALGLERSPKIVAELDRLREYFAVSHLVDREVYQALPMDSVTLRRFYEGHREEYDIPTRVRVLRLVLPTRADASRMAARLREPAEAESLAASAKRQRLDYTADLTAETDGAGFAQAMRAGTGGVIGPDSASGGWAVARVLAVLPPRPRGFDEARTLVEHQWYGVEGERRMVELIERLRRAARVRVNEHALARIAPR